MAVRVRRSLASLLNDPADTTLAWYAKGIAAMRQRPLKEPRSWGFQAAIHDFPAEEELANPSDPVLPPLLTRQKYWRQCQHFSWYFLPWHRMYLHHFERMMMDAIADAGGPSDWALPFWDYSEFPNDVRLPAPFREPKTPANLLYTQNRRQAANAGDVFADADDVDLQPALDEPNFEADQDPLTGFGGFGGPVTLFNHDQGDFMGALDMSPHGSIHVRVGGGMGGFSTAPLDPIFWLHHCNIDRVWEVWLRQDGRANPTSDAWLLDVPFDFMDAAGQPSSMTPSQVVDTTAPPLEYEYEGLGPLVHATLPPAAARAARGRRMSELVGATRTGFDLKGGVTRAVVDTPKIARAPGSVAAMAAGRPKRVVLHIEGLTAEGDACSYDVYVGLPEGASPSEHRNRRVGRLPMFGLKEASRRGGAHAGTGLRYKFDVTKLLAELGIGSNVTPGELHLSFVPLDGDAGSTVHVARVSLYTD